MSFVCKNSKFNLYLSVVQQSQMRNDLEKKHAVCRFDNDTINILLGSSCY